MLYSASMNLSSILVRYQRLRVRLISGHIFYRLSVLFIRQSRSDELEEIVNKPFEDGLDEIFVKAGGRNFLLFEVPQKDRSPGGPS